MQNTTNHWAIYFRDFTSANCRGLAFCSLTGLLLAYLIVPVDPFQAPDFISAMLKEDGIYENLTALSFAGATVIFALAWWRQRNIFFLLFAAVFFVGAGEEISWGQRVMDYQSPDFFLDYNAQREFNLHNLEWLTMRSNPGQWVPTVGLMFNLFWLIYCVLIPIAAFTSAKINDFLAHIRLPIVNPWIGIFFPINYLVAKLIQSNMSIDRLKAVEYYVEVAEFVFAYLFAMVALEFLLRSTHLPRKKQDFLPNV